MSNPTNLADRIAEGLESVAPHPALLVLALEATAEGITAASAGLLQEWAWAIISLGYELGGGVGQDWAAIAADMRSLAYEKTSGVKHRIGHISHGTPCPLGPCLHVILPESSASES